MAFWTFDLFIFATFGRAGFGFVFRFHVFRSPLALISWSIAKEARWAARGRDLTSGGQPFVPLPDTIIFGSRAGGKEIDDLVKSLRKMEGKRKMKFPLLRSVIPECQNMVFWMVKKMSKINISNGHNWGAIWSYKRLSTTVGTARTWSCSGEGSQGGWN